MSNKLAATFHPYSSYEAMTAARDQERREQAHQALAHSIDQYHDRANTYPIGNLAKQKRPKQ